MGFSGVRGVLDVEIVEGLNSSTFYLTEICFYACKSFTYNWMAPLPSTTC